MRNVFKPLGPLLRSFLPREEQEAEIVLGELWPEIAGEAGMTTVPVRLRDGVLLVRPNPAGAFLSSEQAQAAVEAVNEFWGCRLVDRLVVEEGS